MKQRGELMDDKKIDGKGPNIRIFFNFDFVEFFISSKSFKITICPLGLKRNSL